MKSQTDIVWAVPRQFEHLLGDRPKQTDFDRPIGKARAVMKVVNLRGEPYIKILWESWETGKPTQYGPRDHSRLTLRMVATLDPAGTCKLKWPTFYSSTGLFHGRGLHFTGRGFISFEEIGDLMEIVAQAEDFLKEVRAQRAV